MLAEIVLTLIILAVMISLIIVDDFLLKGALGEVTSSD